MSYPTRPLAATLLLEHGEQIRRLLQSKEISTREFAAVLNSAAMGRINWRPIHVNKFFDWLETKPEPSIVAGENDPPYLSDYTRFLKQFGIHMAVTDRIIEEVTVSEHEGAFFWLPLPSPIGSRQLALAYLRICMWMRSSTWNPHGVLYLGVKPSTVELLREHFEKLLKDENIITAKFDRHDFCKKALGHLRNQ